MTGRRTTSFVVALASLWMVTATATAALDFTNGGKCGPEGSADDLNLDLQQTGSTPPCRPVADQPICSAAAFPLIAGPTTFPVPVGTVEVTVDADGSDLYFSPQLNSGLRLNDVGIGLSPPSNLGSVSVPTELDAYYSFFSTMVSVDAALKVADLPIENGCITFFAYTSTDLQTGAVIQALTPGVYGLNGIGSTPTLETFCLSSCPVCGSGVLDPGEECDDGNNLAGDGCSDTCLLECAIQQGQWTVHGAGDWMGRDAMDYLALNFASAFPNGLLLGGPTHVITITSLASLKWLLISRNEPAALGASYFNPLPNSGAHNALAATSLALTLNIVFDATDPGFSASSTPLGDLVLTGGSFAGQTVADLLAEANFILGGGTSPFFTAVSVTQEMNSVLGNFLTAVCAEFPTGDRGVLRCPEPDQP